ncbi:DUF2141 domain-containing protein [Costertonia aggregata]|uniref:DUF2141 domain-containing protein n=1 Tax=Costertonia aggregata TaxID=343403 RepID=A0A7H9ANU3_9FLAO|nr:DUF2141 domain-containing protein [Costertonia aggregata]QLG45097.1 DUF2141 domain-containing protein [Costertonia aggregata]
MKKIFFILILIPFFGMAQNNLSVSVTGVKNSKGKIRIAAYDKAKGFLKFDSVFAAESAQAVKGTTNLTLNLPKGKYALAVFHDENDNGKLDTNWLGIPKEKVAFSKAKMKTFGPPSFEECAFTVEEDQKLSISF